MSLNHFIPQRSEDLLKVQYQPLFPLEYDGLFGPYKPVSSLRDSIQKDFEYLLLTNPGEWPMNPDLGISVRRYLFETYGSPEMNKIEERMRIQLQRYLPFPYISFISANFESTPEQQDQGYSSLKIKYAILDDLVRLMVVTRDSVNMTNITTATGRAINTDRLMIPTSLRSEVRTVR